MPYYTYILYSYSKDRYYIGSCEDLDSRLKHHNAGATPSTKSGRPWKIAWFEKHQTKTEAILQERLIKNEKPNLYRKIDKR